MSGSRKFRAGGGSLIIGALALMASLLSISPLSAQEPSVTVDGPLIEVDRLVGSFAVTSAEVGVYPDTGIADGARPTGGTATLTLPDGATPVRVMAYWAGRGPGWSDPEITINGTAITAERDYTWSWPANVQHVYATDVTDRVTVPSGTSEVSFSGLASPEGDRPYGASLVVVYEDPSLPEVQVVMHEGNDFAFGLSAFSDANGNAGFHSSVTCTALGRASEDRAVALRLRIAGVDAGKTGGAPRTQQLQVFTSDGPVATPTRPLSRFTTISPATGADTIIDNPIAPRADLGWGFSVAEVGTVLSAGESHFCSQALTTSLGDGDGASLALTDGTVSAGTTYRVGNLGFVDVDGDGLASAADQALGGITIELWAADGTEKITDTVISNEGQWAFQFLSPGSYQIVVPSGQIAQVDDELIPLSDFVAALEGTADDVDNDSNLIASEEGWRTPIFTLGDDGSDGEFVSGASIEPTTEVHPFTGEDDDPDDLSGEAGNYDDVRSDFTIDLGFVLAPVDDEPVDDEPIDDEPVDDEPVDDDPPVDDETPTGTIGDLVWRDVNNNGRVDEGEPGIAGVVIELFADEIADGAPDGNTEMIATTTSDETGAYALTGLPAGSYVALLPLSNWDEGGALYGCASSDPTTVNPSDRVEDDDNGVSLLDMGILAGPIVLDTNDDADSSIDFGCFDPLFDLALTTTPTSEEPLRVGDDLTVRIEVENQGTFSAGRVEVTVYLPEELELADEAWTVDPDGRISRFLDIESLKAGETITTTVTATVVAPGDLTIAAEISELESIARMPNRGSFPDRDSVPDRTNDDRVVDDETGDDGTFDEDDHDIVFVTVDLEDPIEPPEPPEPRDPGDDAPDSIEVPFPIVTFVPVPVFVPYPFPVFVPVPFRVEHPVHTDVAPTEVAAAHDETVVGEETEPSTADDTSEETEPFNDDPPATGDVFVDELVVDDTTIDDIVAPIGKVGVTTDEDPDSHTENGVEAVTVEDVTVDVVMDEIVAVTVATPDAEGSDDSDPETIIVEVQGRTETREPAGAPSEVVAGNIVAVAQVPTVTVLPQVDADPQLAITGNEARLGFLFSLMMMVVGAIFWLLGNRRRLVEGNQ